MSRDGPGFWDGPFTRVDVEYRPCYLSLPSVMRDGRLLAPFPPSEPLREGDIRIEVSLPLATAVWDDAVWKPPPACEAARGGPGEGESAASPPSTDMVGDPDESQRGGVADRLSGESQ